MDAQNNLTTGNISKVTVRFALPYLLSCFMQTFYGIADLFVVGRYSGTHVTTAVAVGSQVMHMLTVIILGLAMGTTVLVGRAAGAGDKKAARRAVGTTVVLFSVISIVLMAVLLIFTDGVTKLIMTPAEAVQDTKKYLSVCFSGIPFIVAYNVISSVFRGAGNSKYPMYFVGIACAVNIALDFLFVGGFHLGAVGAAWGTVCGQAASVAVSLFFLKRTGLGFRIKREDIRADRRSAREIVKIGLPVALQDGLIQVAFLVITAIANSRGLVFATGVGVVEKLISFLFLVPSAFLSAISAITAQNTGAGLPERARKALGTGLLITSVWGGLCALYCQFFPGTLVGLFSKDADVLSAGCDYLRSYSFDTLFAALHFCFSGYFCGNGKSGISFLHNILSILLVRIPGAYLASLYYPGSLYPMGWAAPLGSLLSAVICAGFFWAECRQRAVRDRKASAG